MEAQLSKVTVLRRILHHGPIYAKKGDEIEVRPELAAEWIKAGHVAAVSQKATSRRARR